MWRYRWHALIAMWGVALVGWAVVALTPNVYGSHARIFVDAETVLKPLLSGLAVGTDLASQANTMSRVMLARPSLERVARETDFHLRAENPEDLPGLVRALGERIQIASSPYDRNLYTIGFTDRDPAMAQRVVQSLLNSFVEDTLGIKREDSTEAQLFLEERIKEYETRLRAAEDRLAEFKKRNVGLMPGEAGGYYERLQTATARLEAVQAEYRAAESKRVELLRQLEGEEPTFGIVPGASDVEQPTSVDAQISQQESRLAMLLVRFTEKHPEVIAARETIAELEAQRAKEAAGRRRTGGPASSAGANALNINPVYQSMRIALSQAEVQLVELRNKLANEQREVAKVRSLVSTAPQVEAELVRLNRDYEVNRTQHQALLKSLETARLSGEAASSKEQTRFRVIEPPVVPMRPSAPNRAVLNAGVLLLAGFMGLALAFGLHQLNPVFSTRQELESTLGLPVLGGVMFAPSASAARALRNQSWLVATGAALLLIASGVVIAHSFQFDAPISG